MKILCAKYNNMNTLHPNTTHSVPPVVQQLHAIYRVQAKEEGNLATMLCKNIMLIPYSYTQQYLLYLSLQTLQQIMNNCMGYTYTHIQFSTRGLFRGAREGFLGFQKLQNFACDRNNNRSPSWDLQIYETIVFCTNWQHILMHTG